MNYTLIVTYRQDIAFAGVDVVKDTATVSPRIFSLVGNFLELVVAVGDAGHEPVAAGPFTLASQMYYKDVILQQTRRQTRRIVDFSGVIVISESYIYANPLNFIVVENQVAAGQAHFVKSCNDGLFFC